jgi:hypothetical protein
MDSASNPFLKMDSDFPFVSIFLADLARVGSYAVTSLFCPSLSGYEDDRIKVTGLIVAMDTM